MDLKTVFLGIIALIVVGVGAWFVTRDMPKPNSVTAEARSFEECVSQGNAIMESYPRQCRTQSGLLFAEEIVVAPTYQNATADSIVVELPYPGAVTGKEFGVTGKARGTWYFEASFPVVLIDPSGKVIATGIAQAEGDWMTENFVPFRAEIKAPSTYMGPATLVLRKDNPSGLPEHDASVSFPITVEY
jgi:hypothetical protein